MNHYSENLNPAYYEELTPDNCAILLIDHQAGLFLGVHSIDQQVLKNNSIALAKAAKAMDIPTIITTSSAVGPNGPTIPEIINLFPGQPIHDRSPINLWNDETSREAIQATGRKKLIMAAITTDVCLLFPALAALKEGYDVYAVLDASGTWSEKAELATALRLQQAGAICTNWISVAAELKYSEDMEHTDAVNKVFGEHMGLYDFLGNQMAAQQQLA